MDALILKALGPILTAVGSIILAIRLEAIIDAILIGTEAHQKAIQKLFAGQPESEALRASHTKVREELQKAKKILFWGFVIVALGGMVNALSYFIN